jgi:hypothetical protein
MIVSFTSKWSTSLAMDGRTDRNTGRIVVAEQGAALGCWNVTLGSLACDFLIIGILQPMQDRIRGG